ncbi:MAG: quinoprotein dehydrogenase-associated putative ABC transporter substrate-binding protein [Methylocystis sp.]|uniref:quinoprotein dehydrogenase-associated putative ABC transporter substrate-binding protein n=1 Tax=Methylocystis sp. TaxID=1911079 RepID=UPI003DA4E0E2
MPRLAGMSVGLLALGAALFSATVASAEAEAPKEKTKLTICSDPANLPYSNRAREGFENRIAEVLAADLHADLDAFWFAEHKGFVRRTLLDGLCDAIISVPSNFSMVATTRPYFTSSYVAVTRANAQQQFSSFDDAWLRDARIGLQLVGNEGATTPPAIALARRGFVEHITSFPMWAEDETSNPQGAIIDAVAKGDVDIAFVWGPFAEFFAKAHDGKLRVTPVLSDPRSPDQLFVFSMSVGVRKSDEALRDRLQDALDRHAPEIRKILEEFGTPLTATPAVERAAEATAAASTDAKR